MYHTLPNATCAECKKSGPGRFIQVEGRLICKRCHVAIYYGGGKAHD